MTGRPLKESILTDGIWTDEGTQYTVNKEFSHRTIEGFFFVCGGGSGHVRVLRVYEDWRNYDCSTDSKFSKMVLFCFQGDCDGN